MLIKKSLVAIAALSLSAAALANGGAYGVPSNSSFGSDAGFVVGIQGGYGDNHWGDYWAFDGVPGILPAANVNTTGFAARGYLGYDFNKYLGLEAGYTYLPKTSVTYAHTAGELSIKQYAVDLLAKLSVPVTNVFSLYAKAGASYLHSSESVKLYDENSSSSSNIGPAFGVGAAYEVIPNLAIDLSWMRFSGQSNQAVDESYQPSPDVVLLGISYKFPVSYS